MAWLTFPPRQAGHSFVAFSLGYAHPSMRPSFPSLLPLLLLRHLTTVMMKNQNERIAVLVAWYLLWPCEKDLRGQLSPLPPERPCIGILGSWARSSDDTPSSLPNTCLAILFVWLRSLSHIQIEAAQQALIGFVFPFRPQFMLYLPDLFAERITDGSYLCDRRTPPPLKPGLLPRYFPRLFSPTAVRHRISIPDSAGVVAGV